MRDIATAVRTSKTGAASSPSTSTTDSPLCNATTPAFTYGSPQTEAGQDARTCASGHSGAESFLARTASCRIETEDIDGLYVELAAADVLHPVSRDGVTETDVLHPVWRDGVTETDFGTREFATLDADGNLIEFFCWTR